MSNVRRVRQGPALGVLLLLWSAVAVLLAAPASAHAVLLATSPAAGYSVSGPVERVSLTFSEAVTATPAAIRIAGPTPGLRPVAVSGDGGRTLRTRTPRLQDGSYLVTWQVTADDGDVVTGSYRFGVGAGTDPATLVSRSPLDPVTGSFLATAAARWALFAALAVALGGLGGTALAGRLVSAAAQAGARPLPPAAAVPFRAACILGAVAAVVLAAHAVNGASFVTGLSSLRRWHPRGAGGPPLAEGVLFAAAAAAVSVPRRHGRLVAVLSLLGVAVAEGIRGHLHELDGAAGAALVGVHLAVAAAWTGALVAVTLTAARWRAAGRSNAAWQLVHDYSRAALGCYLLVIATGIAAAALLLPSWGSLISTRYGISLLVKVAVVAVVTALAALGRAHLRRTETIPATHRLRPAEPAVMTVVLLAAAVLVSFAPPRLLAAADAPVPPPAPTGPVVQVGTLAGQLTVGVTVAAGQIRIQVSSPSSDDDSADRFTVTASTTASTTASPRLLTLSSCGDGCFAGPAAVTAPGLALDLNVAATGWHGGHPRFAIPWPPVPATAELRQTLALLARASALTWLESVTSDTSRPAPPAVTLHDSGQSLLDTEVYGDGRGLTPIQLPAADTARRFAFGVGGRYFVEMTVDARGRLLREQLVTPNHLIVRTFRPAP